MYARVAIVIAIGLLIWNVVLSRQQEAIVNRLRGDPYELDSISRFVRPGAAASCPPEITIIEYRGTTLSYTTPLYVAPAFAPKLAAFERLVAELAQRYYGRPPSRIQHLGSRNCRSVRGRPDRLSEHALGNALDVSGFEFDAVAHEVAASKSKPKQAARLGRAKADTPASARVTLETAASDKSGADGDAAFTISVLAHWRRGTQRDSARHSAFLHELAQRAAVERVFRGVIGPGHEGHADHLHFDQGPWTYAAL